MGKSGLVPDNTNIKKTSGTPNLFFDSKNNVEYEKNQDNIIYKVTSTQLPAMVGGAFADVYLSKGNIREPHWHPNAWELDVIISGEAQISMLIQILINSIPIMLNQVRLCLFQWAGGIGLLQLLKICICISSLTMTNLKQH